GLLVWLLGLAAAMRAPSAHGVSLASGTVAGLVLAGLLAGWLEPPPRPQAGRIALVDAAHLNDISMDLWNPEALSGLNVNLARNGYLALVDRDAAAGWIDSADVFVSVAPRRHFTRSELSSVLALAERGGEAILSVGWEEKDPSS